MKVFQRAIVKQLGMLKATLMRDLAFARANPRADLISVWNKESSHPAQLSALPPWTS
jgi:hypothetical protein